MFLAQNGQDLGTEMFHAPGRVVQYLLKLGRLARVFGGQPVEQVTRQDHI